jgi:hypothetical protein
MLINDIIPAIKQILPIYPQRKRERERERERERVDMCSYLIMLEYPY